MNNYILSWINNIYDTYSWALTVSDPRVKNWLLMNGWSATWCLTIAYLLIVYVGQRIMSNFKAFELRWTLFVYNGALVALNWHILSELLVCSWQLGYSYSCQHIQYSYHPLEMRIAAALWWYYFSKLIEFMDTFFFVLRKKNSQITFLHLYHHASMFPLWWIGIKWFAGGLAFLGAMINSFVHVVMYTYYGMAALGPHYQKYLWWKKYLTKLQLAQFVIGLIFGSQLILLNCTAIPMWVKYSGVAYGVSMIVLFLNFYYQEYVVRLSRTKGKGTRSKNDSVKSGSKTCH